MQVFIACVLQLPVDWFQNWWFLWIISTTDCKYKKAQVWNKKSPLRFGMNVRWMFVLMLQRRAWIRGACSCQQINAQCCPIYRRAHHSVLLLIGLNGHTSRYLGNGQQESSEFPICVWLILYAGSNNAAFKSRDLTYRGIPCWSFLWPHMVPLSLAGLNKAWGAQGGCVL